MITIKAPKTGAQISTSWGSAIALEPGETRTVAPCFLEPAMKAGCIVIGSEDADVPPQVVGNTEERRTKILEVVARLIKEGDAANFTPKGKLKNAVVAAAVGFDVTAAEIAAATEAVLNGDAG